MLGGYVLVALMMMTYIACLLAALSLSSPTFVAVVSLFVTPVTLVWDLAAGRTGSLSPLSLIGMSLLIGALLLVIFYGCMRMACHTHGPRATRMRVSCAACVHTRACLRLNEILTVHGKVHV